MSGQVEARTFHVNQYANINRYQQLNISIIKTTTSLDCSQRVSGPFGAFLQQPDGYSG